MALQKTFTLPNGASGNYIKIISAEADYVGKYIPVHFALYMNAQQAAAAPGAPLAPLLAKLRLEGEKFDEYLSTAALAANAADDPFRSQLYIAAKTEPLIAGAVWQVDLSDAIDV